MPIEWSSSKLKILGVFIGYDDVDITNWRPRIEAVENCLSSWRSGSSSYGGKALVVNALALSRIWYIASLVHMPPWVLAELNCHFQVLLEWETGPCGPGFRYP